MAAITPTRSQALRVSPGTTATGTRTLSIDIGGTGLKALILGPDGAALTERARVDTPKPATPKAVLAALWSLIEPLGEFDRISIGFPGVVVEGVTMTYEVNLCDHHEIGDPGVLDGRYTLNPDL